MPVLNCAFPAFLALTLAASLQSQSLPSYMTSQYPPPGSTAVPTNSPIALEGSCGIFAGASYTLRTQAGTDISLKQAVSSGYDPNCNVIVRPTAALAPSTHYTFTLKTTAAGSASYSFDFTTGAAADTTGPHLVSIDPKPGTAGIAVSGPITLKFDKYIDQQAFIFSDSVVDQGLQFFYNGSSRATPDGYGVVLTPTSEYLPVYIDLTIAPAQVTDIFGNKGTGDPFLVHYTTFVASQPAPPNVKSTFPANGDTGLPTNVSIRVLFDKSMDQPSSVCAAFQIQSKGSSLPITCNTFANSHGIVITPAQALSPNQTYRVTIGANVKDSNETPLGQASSFDFTTGSSGPDISAAQAIDTAPAPNSKVPPNVVISARSNKRVMPLCTFLFDASSGIPTPLAGTLSADGRSIQFTPVTPFTPGASITLNLQDVVDITGGAIFPNTGFEITVGQAEDHQAPAAPTLFPQDGTSGAAVAHVETFQTPVIEAQFAEPMGIATGGDPIRVTTQSGQAVAGKFAWNGNRTTLSFDPASDLAPQTVYRVDIPAIPDLAGNLAPAASSTFTTASGAVSPAQLTSSSISPGDTGVDPSAPIVLVFSNPISVPAAITGTTISRGNTVYPVRVDTNGGTVTITPVLPLPASTQLVLTFSAIDLGGNSAYASIPFSTGASTDTTPPTVASTAPAAGAVLSKPAVTLAFSKPIDPYTLVVGNFSAYVNGAFQSVSITAYDSQSVTLLLPYNSVDTYISVAASPGILDLAGNPLVPFQARFWLPASASTGQAIGAFESRPGRNATTLPADLPEMTWLLTGAIDMPTVNANLIMVANGAPLDGTWSTTENGLVLHFTPNGGFPTGAIQLFQRQAILNIYGYGFTMPAGVDPAKLRIVRYSVPGPTNAVMDVEFNVEPPAGTNILTLFGNYGVELPATQTHPRPRTIRLQPSVSLVAGNYYFIKVDSSVTGDNTNIWFTPTVASTLSTAAITHAAPLPDASNVPLNASIRITFDEPVNPLTVNGQTIKVSCGTKPLYLLYQLNGNNAGLVATPLDFLPGNCQITVAISGLEDRLGRVIPARQWSFQTGSGFDTHGPGILGQTIHGNGAVASRDLAFITVFDEPIDPTASGLEYANDANFRASLSDDLTTITVVPSKPLAQGASYNIYLASVQDLSGNSTSIPSQAFSVSFTQSSTPPHLVSASPDDGATGVPLAPDITLLFDEAVSGAAISGVTLLNGSNTVPLVSRNSTDPHSLHFAPLNLLDANTSYQLQVSGVRDLSGNTMTDTFTRTFTTGNLALMTPLAATFRMTSPMPNNVPLRVTFSRPVDPATLSNIRLARCTATAGCYSGSASVPASISVSSDGLSVTVVPAQPLTAGPYELKLQGVTDLAGVGLDLSSFSNTHVDFTALGSDDTTPPALTLIPSDGLTGLARNSIVRVISSETLDLGAGVIPFTLTTNGTLVHGTWSASGNLYTFSPAQYYPDGTYRLDVPAVADLAGNTSAPVSSTFTVQNSSSPYQLMLVSSAPASGDVGVPLDAQITLTFNKPIYPPSATSAAIQFYSNSSLPIRGKLSVSGSTVVFTPTSPLPAAATITVVPQYGSYYGRLLDLSGNAVEYTGSISFRTVASPYTIPPKLLSVAPQPGTPLPAPTATLTFTFSRPVVIPSTGFAVFNGGQPLSNTYYFGYETDTRIMDLALSVPGNAQLTVTGTSDITDEAGDHLDPFSYTYPTQRLEPSDRPTVTSYTPAAGAQNVSPTTVIRVQFSKLMDPATVLAAVHVTQDGTVIDGKLEMVDSNHAVEFTPVTPYNPGSRIDIYIDAAAADTIGQTFYQSQTSMFIVAATASSNFMTVRRDLESAALEVEFTRDLDRATVDGATVWLRSGRRLVPGEVVLHDARFIRFTPAEPLEAGREYVLTLGSALRSTASDTFTGSEFVFTAAGPRDETIESADVVQALGATAVRVRFRSAHSLLNLDLPAGTKRWFTPDRREWLLVPTDPAQIETIRKAVSR